MNDGHIYFPSDKIRYYGDDHWDLLKSYEDQKIGLKITDNRIDMVKKAIKDFKYKSVLDYGCGTGYFLKKLKDIKISVVYGYDVLQKTVDWLKENNIYYDITVENQELYPVSIVTMWDVIEHLDDPRKILDCIKKDSYLICSVPIINNFENLIHWKHYRPDEHLHYFTHFGFIQYMMDCGFKLIDKNYNETLAGREDIWSFSFKKIKE